VQHAGARRQQESTLLDKRSRRTESALQVSELASDDDSWRQ
jgi:hypothetical protein